MLPEQSNYEMETKPERIGKTNNKKLTASEKRHRKKETEVGNRVVARRARGFSWVNEDYRANYLFLFI